MPIVYTSEEHAFGVTALPSDSMNGIMEQQYAEEFEKKKTERDARLNAKFVEEHKKVRNKPTKTSIIRAITSKRKVNLLSEDNTEYVSVLRERRLRGLSQAPSNHNVLRKQSSPSRQSLSKASTVLPALSRRGMSEKPGSQCDSRAGMG